MSDSSSDGSSSTSESGTTTTGTGTTATGTTTTTSTTATGATGTTVTESTATTNQKRTASKLVSFMNHKDGDGDSSSDSSSSDSDSDDSSSSSDSSSDSDDEGNAAATHGAGPPAQHTSAKATAPRVFTKPPPPAPPAVAAPPPTAVKAPTGHTASSQPPAAQKASDVTTRKGPVAPQAAAAVRPMPPHAEPLKVASAGDSESDSDSETSSSSSEATTTSGAATTTTSGSGSTETSGTTTTSTTTATTTTTTTTTTATGTTATSATTSKSLSTATADATHQRPGKIPSVTVVRVESPEHPVAAAGPSRPAAGVVPTLALTQVQPQAGTTSSMVLKEDSEDDEPSREAAKRPPGGAGASTRPTQGAPIGGGGGATTTAAGDAKPESTANLRYQDDQESSSDEGEDSSTTESAASEDSTIVDADVTAKPPRPSKPSVAVRTIRETETIVVAPTTRPEYTLPMELMVVAGTKSDVFSELCDHALEAQESMLRNVTGSGDGAHERPADAPPPNHLTLGNAFLLCRSTGLGDHESAKLLFGCAKNVEVPFLRALVEQQSEKRLAESLFDAFHQRDPTHSGELPKAVVLRLIEACGCCTRSVARGTFNVHVRSIAGSLFALTKHTVFGSDPPQRRESTVDLSAKNFQMFVDQVRGEVTCNGHPVCSLELTAEYLAEIVQAMQMCVYVNSMIESCETELEGTIVYEPLLNAILTNKLPPLLGGDGFIDFSSQQQQQQQQPPAQKRYRSILLDNAIRSKFHPIAAFDDGLRAAAAVEPFLQRSVASSQQRRVNYVPRTLVGDGSADVKDGINSNGAVATAVQEKSARYFSLWVEAVHIPSVDVPVSASRYLLISLVSTDNVVLPCVRVDAKARKPGEKSTDPWTFSKKKICNNVLVAGQESDALYVEVCFDVPPSAADPSAPKRTVCGGFAACALRDFGSGTLSVKPGTFFRKQQQSSVSDGSASDKSVESSSCFCFAAQPATKIVVAADRLSDPPLLCASLIQENARCVVLERHIKLIAGFRDFLQNPRRLRSQAATALFQLLDRASIVDQLCSCWELESMKFSKEQRRDKKFVNERLLALIVRVAAASQFGDAAVVESTVCHRQPLPYKLSGKAQAVVV